MVISKLQTYKHALRVPFLLSLLPIITFDFSLKTVNNGHKKIEPISHLV